MLRSFLILILAAPTVLSDQSLMGDANCDDALNVGDAVYMINFVFKGGPEPCCP